MACLAPDVPIGLIPSSLVAIAESKKAIISVSDKSGLTELAKVIELSSPAHLCIPMITQCVFAVQNRPEMLTRAAGMLGI